MASSDMASAWDVFLQGGEAWDELRRNPDPENYNRWLTPRLEAYIWFCGDLDCDCSQPMIEHIEPNLRAGYPWIKREHVWKGTYRAEASMSEYKDQVIELRKACKRYGVAVPDIYRPAARDHRDHVVRLHGGSEHGRIMTLPDSPYRDGHLFVPVLPKLRSYVSEEFDPITARVETATYRRHKLMIYDDVDDAYDVYDYWLAEGESLPEVGRYPRW